MGISKTIDRETSHEYDSYKHIKELRFFNRELLGLEEAIGVNLVRRDDIFCSRVLIQKSDYRRSG